jgi:hypothetical protein
MLSNFKVGRFQTEGIQSLLLPDGIVFISEINGSGDVIFSSSFNKKRLALIDSNFYSNLEFNEKGFERTIRISGSTEVVPNGFVKKEDGTELILLKMKVSKIEIQSNKKTVFDAVPQKINNWLKQMLPSNRVQKTPQVGFN